MKLPTRFRRFCFGSSSELISRMLPPGSSSDTVALIDGPSVPIFQNFAKSRWQFDLTVNRCLYL